MDSNKRAEELMRMPIPLWEERLNPDVKAEDLLELISMAYKDLSSAIEGNLKVDTYEVIPDFEWWGIIEQYEQDERPLCYACLSGIVFISHKGALIDWNIPEYRPYYRVIKFLDSLRNFKGWTLLERYGFRIPIGALKLENTFLNPEGMLQQLKEFLELNVREIPRWRTN
jgi:hypothetical protein